MQEVFRTPELDATELAVIELIDNLRTEMKGRVDESPKRWSGVLRRMLEAQAVRGSNTIEGYEATLDDVLAVMDGDEPLDASTETRYALQGYREAMTYAVQASQDDAPFIDEGLLKAWHFMMVKHDLSKWPGRYRPGEIFVFDEAKQERVYEGPPFDLVPGLIEEMIEEIEVSEHVPVLVRGAMAHLNLVMIHPFKDGNGRMARCLQTYVLAREKILSPSFSSIEEYLGRRDNTRAYYDVLAQVGGGSWHPENDARPWVRFCLTAHYRQALTVFRRIRRFEQLWVQVARLAEERRLPERSIGPLCEAAMGRRIRRATYVASVGVTWGEEIPLLTASRDLKALVTAGLFAPVGDTRGRFYLPTAQLRRIWDRIRSESQTSGADADPFERIQLQLELSA